MESLTLDCLLESTNNTMAMTITNNNITTFALKSPLKYLCNEWRHFGHLKQPDKAANKASDFVKTVVYATD